MLAEALRQMMVEKLALAEVRLLAELFGEDKPQEDLFMLPTISLPSSLLVLFPEVFNLSVLTGLVSPIVTPTFTAPPPSLPLAVVMVPPIVAPPYPI